MSKHLSGHQLDDFRTAVERFCIDYAEAIALARREPSDIDDWRQQFLFQREVWKRMGADLADMVMAATGDDIREFVELSDDLD